MWKSEDFKDSRLIRRQDPMGICKKQQMVEEG